VRTVYLSPKKALQKMQQVTHHVFKAALSENIGPFLHKYDQPGTRSTPTADRVRKDIYSLGAKIDVNVKAVFTSRKLSQTLSVKESKPPIVNTQCVVYLFKCDLCDANYVGFTARHLHQRISEHRYSAIRKHLETQHGNNRKKIDPPFKVPRKCNSKFN